MKEHLFKVGDTVKVVDNLKEGNTFKVYCNNQMTHYRGKEMVISSSHRYKDYPCYRLEKLTRWEFTEDMLEPINKEPFYSWNFK